MSESTNQGHRQRLQDRFMNGEESSRSDEALIELLLTYAIPQRDVQPLAKQLLATHGGLISVLETPVEALCRTAGIKENSAALIKLVDWIRRNVGQKSASRHSSEKTPSPTLFDSFQTETQKRKPVRKPAPKPKDIKRRGAVLFGKAVLAEAIDILPRLPDSESLEETRAFLRTNLHFSAELTRQRYTRYIVSRMFADGHADGSLRYFAKAFPNTQELRDVCFYRFMRAEPLEIEVIEELLLPNIGKGNVTREQIRKRLKEKFPKSRSIADSGKAVVDALTAGGIATADAKSLSFAYRDIPIVSFAFVLHSEFPEPGMFDVSKLKKNRLVRAMLWNPERLLYTLYELRNQGLISKVSEIDGIRQFTTKHTLAGAIEQLVSRRISPKMTGLYPDGDKRA